MEVHAHNLSHGKKNWKQYFWEFFMMFLAVTLGFLVENQREHYIEHQRLIRFAKQLVRGLEKDTTMQNEVLELLRDKEDAFDSLRYYLGFQKDDSTKWIGIYRNAWGLENPFRITYQKPVFDQINNSGSLRLFTNPAIIDSIMDYIFNATLIDWQTSTEIEYISGTISPFLNDHFDKNLILQRFGTHIRTQGNNDSFQGAGFPMSLIENAGSWKRAFENIVITAREKFELPYGNIREERDRAVTLISSLKKEYHLRD